MADKKKRTILMSEDKSRENWKPSLSKRIVRALRGKSKRSGFGVKAQITPTDSIKAGISKNTKTPGSSTAANPATGRRRARRSKNLGFKIEHKF